MSEFVSYQAPEKKSLLSKAAKYALATVVVIGGIGLAVELGPGLIKAAEAKLLAASPVS